LELEIENLPERWNSNSPILQTQSIGDSFIESKEFAVLRVTSSKVPLEYNYLINPNHNDASKIKVVPNEPMRFDKRITKKSNK